MILTRQQLDAFAKYNEEGFVRRTAEHLRQRYPQVLVRQGLAGEKVDAFVRETAARAAAYRVTNEPDIRAFCELRLEVGPNFDRDAARAWIGDILADANMSGAAKMDAIIERVALEQAGWS